VTFNTHTNKPPLFTLKVSVDFVSLHFPGTVEIKNQTVTQDIRNVAMGSGIFKKHYHSPNRPYSYYEAYVLPIPSYGICYDVKIFYPQTNIYPLRLKIEHPDRIGLLYLNDLIGDFKYHIGNIEFCFDFLTTDVTAMYSFLKNCMFLKWKGKDLDLQYETTLYLNNVRKSVTKGCRLYIKERGDRAIVRIDFLLKREFLRRKDIVQIPDLINMETPLVTKYLDFKIINFELFQKRFKKLYDDESDLPIFIEMIHELMEERSIYHANKLAESVVGKGLLKEHPFSKEFQKRLQDRRFF